MKWMIVVLVNFLPNTGQVEMQDYRNYPFSSKEECLTYVNKNRQHLINDTNKAYGRYNSDYDMTCITMENFSDIWLEDIDPQKKQEI